MPARPTWRARAIGFGDITREGEDEEAIKRMFTPEFRNRLDAIVPFGYLPTEVVARVVDKFILQLELQLADRNVHIELDDEARAWLTARGYDKLYGARPMGRLIQEKIKQPLAEELLFGKLVHGGEVKVTIKDNAPSFEIVPAPPKAPRKKAKKARRARRREGPARRAGLSEPEANEKALRKRGAFSLGGSLGALAVSPPAPPGYRPRSRPAGGSIASGCESGRSSDGPCGRARARSSCAPP